MDTSASLGPRRSRAAERIALALGLVAALALGTAALLPGEDREASARARLARLAGEVEDAVVAEWRRALRELPARLDRSLAMLRWNDGVPARPPRPAADSAAESAAYTALSLDAESAQDPVRGLELARAALGAAQGERARSTSQLRLVQRARRAGDDALAAETWRAARGNTAGSIEIAGVGAPLAIFLAAADALSPEERIRDATDLAVSWSRGEIALPIAKRAAEIDPRVDVLAERLALAAGTERQSVATLLEQSHPRLRAASLVAATGEMPAECEGASWSLAPRDGALLARHAATSGGCEGFLLTVPDAERVLTAAAGRVLPEEFALDVNATEPGELLRPRLELVPGVLAFGLRHRDVAGWIARDGARANWLRAGLALLAVACAVAGFLAARALARERHLAEMRAAFVAGVSHELRTPVAAILLLAENLEAGRVDGDPARYHGLIRREALRLRRLVDGVLDFSRLERGRGIEVAREDVEVREWLAQIASEATAWARQSDVELELELELGAAPATACIDREALRRALWNLLENALRHSGSKRVTLRARAEEAELVLEVEDAGRGIPSARRTAIFEPFARFAEPGTPGTGLGLALVSEIARAHGGSIAVADGADGRGARFTLRVPTNSEERT